METRHFKAAGLQTRTYSRLARVFHWSTAVAVAVMVPLGFAMVYRGETLDIWDGLTDALYSTHKLIGFLLIWLIAVRLLTRWRRGVPPDEPGLPAWQIVAAHSVHGLLYALLLVVPVLGWIGVSLYPSLTLFNAVDLPALTRPNEELAERVLEWHGRLAILLALVAGAHIAAALYHRFVTRDGVLRRMWP